MNIKFIYNENEKEKLNLFLGKMLEYYPETVIITSKKIPKDTRIVVVASDYFSLKSAMKKLDKGQKFSILTFDTKASYILICLKFSNSICYGKGNIKEVMKKINKCI